MEILVLFSCAGTDCDRIFCVVGNTILSAPPITERMNNSGTMFMVIKLELVIPFILLLAAVLAVVRKEVVVSVT